ncbi:hypothetical protein [Haloarcula onubensis]|uniref:Uncharacterized protein n=1 Tax=Haloarcula onubensis TaxID=2950539 RepID=A0ABU2FSI6_9EURY|nr:hypothetical protein [Halomicroarcula sp. S3CR25-11]MDS0283116.1 hypothetical protein [Halomicroarcula sp. S3CR25-11]
MADEPPTDGAAAVDPMAREDLRGHLEQFAGADRVTESGNGTLAVEFSGSTYFLVDPDGRVEGGMPLHGFDGPADELQFDHEHGEIHVSAGDGAVSYTFRRPSR